MTAFGKKWLTGLVTGALMAVSAGSLAAEQKTIFSLPEKRRADLSRSGCSQLEASPE